MAGLLSLLHARQGGGTGGMHCTARLTACPFCMRGREEALASLQLSMAAPRWPALQEGAPTGEQGAGRPGRLAS